MINGFADNSIERQIQIAALEGKWDAYFNFYNMLENLHDAQAQRKNFIKVFLGQPGPSILEQITSKGPVDQTDIIVNHILSLYSKFEFNLDYFSNDQAKRMYTWAGMHNLSSILNHTLVKEEMLIEKAKSLLLANNLEAARKVIKNSNITMERVLFHKSLFQELLAKFNNDYSRKSLDAMLADLVSKNEMSLDLVYFGQPVNLANIAQFPLLAKTDAFRAVNAISTLATETYGDDVQHLVATRMIDEYLENLDAHTAARLATSLLRNAVDLWGPVMPAAPSSPQKEAIVLQLLNYGAQVPYMPMMMMPPMTSFHSMVFELGMNKVINHPKVIDTFKKAGSVAQKMFIEQACPLNDPAHIPSQANLDMLQALIPHAKQNPLSTDYAEVTSFPCMTLESFIQTLNTWSNTPHDPASHERKLKILGLLLKHEMIDNIASVAQGSHALTFNNPNTGAPYDLHAYIMENPTLKAGFLKPQRDVQLLSLYGLTKGLLAAETRNAQVMEKVRAREAFVQQRENGTAVVSNRYDIKPLMQSTPRDVRALIMSWVDSSTLPQGQRLKTARNLESIAREHLVNSTVNVQESAKYIKPAVKK